MLNFQISVLPLVLHTYQAKDNVNNLSILLTSVVVYIIYEKDALFVSPSSSIYIVSLDMSNTRGRTLILKFNV